MEEVFLKRKKFFMSIEDKSMLSHSLLREKTNWKASNGTVHRIMDMDKNYLKNCINKIKRDEFIDDRVNVLPILENELIYRQILTNDTR